ncbi:hypothetical protein [Feifania hominis]|uniref:Uncharacterized protein n=1 Tax=Feifania hominis TaxID=2763660 RepID=A0A926HVK4_9FIRM|nr:hypothetical protein [Feifania hominis]MBC8537080.1 hypothetical protein [Feifania hominis]
MQLREELLLLRDLLQQADNKIGSLLQTLERPDGQSTAASAYETIYSLNTAEEIFKGKRPTGVIFEDGTREDLPTWKKVFEAILKHCNQNPQTHQALMDLRGKLLGRNRVLLGSEKGQMRSPIKIDRALYAESHYDTQTLLKILTGRILTAAGYDYSRIRIAVQNG